MIQGTMSNVGKSFIVTGLCRYFANEGYRVAPFKAQNMALNSYATAEGLEMGRAQATQAFAAMTTPSVDMNPILLKPVTDVGSQVIVRGRSVGNMKAADYYEYKQQLVPIVLESFAKLDREYDIIIIEGAGSPAEINLRENDIVNMGLAKLVKAPVLIAGDIDPGGVFAQLYGTLSLLEPEDKRLVRGMLINKFRGDVNLLLPGIKTLESKCSRKVLGVIPMSEARIEEEDSMNLPGEAGTKKSENEKQKAEGKDDAEPMDIAVIKLPRMSNFTDFDAISEQPGMKVRYVSSAAALGKPDLLIIPGTKSTIPDLRYIKASGMAAAIKALAGECKIMGICGGYQMLGIDIDDPDETEGGGREEGLGLLGIKTVLDKEKITTQTRRVIEDAPEGFGFLNGVLVSGYEIHNGRSYRVREEDEKLVYGTYIHGFFDEDAVRNAFLGRTESTYSYEGFRNHQFELAAEAVSANCDMHEIKKIMGMVK